MELGEKLRQARLEAGLSQRQLAGTEITRNMLSQIENGSAMPSMKTLRYLADALGKSLGYFLGEAASSPNQGILDSARRLYDAGEDRQAALVLEVYQGPDPVYDREKALLWCLIHLRMAEAALEEGRLPYARTLLEKADTHVPYCAPELTRRRLLLLGRLPGETVSHRLPSLDDELRLRAEEALTAGDLPRAAALLEAAQDQASLSWNLLRGRVYFAGGSFAQAARCFRLAEEAGDSQVLPLLEGCYRELGDYRLAYEYACKQR